MVLTAPEPPPGSGGRFGEQRARIRRRGRGGRTVAAAAAITPQAVAVFPLVSIGNDAQASQAAEGSHRSFATAISRVPGVRSRPRRLRPRSARVCEHRRSGRALNATMLIEGTVQRANQRLRASIRLVSVANDSTVWASTIDGTTNDPLALQDSTVKAAAAAVAASTRR